MPELIQAIAIEAALIGASAEEAAADDFMKPNDAEQTLFARFVKAGKSQNTITNFLYPAEVLEQATPLFDGAHVYENHPDPDEMRRRKGVRNVKDKVGRIKSPRWNAAAQAVEGRLQIFNKALYEQYKLGGDAYGLSMEAAMQADENVRANPRLVGRIDKIQAVAIVDLAGAGGSIVAAAEAAYVAAEEAAREESTMELTIADVQKAVTEGIAAFMAAAKAEEAASNQTDWQAEAETAKAKLARLEALEAARRAGSELNAASKVKLGGYTLATACEAALSDCADLKPETIAAAVKARFDALIADQPTTTTTNPVRGMGAATASEAAQQPAKPNTRNDYELAKSIWGLSTPAMPSQNGGAANGR